MFQWSESKKGNIVDTYCRASEKSAHIICAMPDEIESIVKNLKKIKDESILIDFNNGEIHQKTQATLETVDLKSLKYQTPKTKTKKAASSKEEAAKKDHPTKVDFYQYCRYEQGLSINKIRNYISEFLFQSFRGQISTQQKNHLTEFLLQNNGETPKLYPDMDIDLKLAKSKFVSTFKTPTRLVFNYIKFSSSFNRFIHNSESK